MFFPLFVDVDVDNNKIYDGIFKLDRTTRESYGKSFVRPRDIACVRLKNARQNAKT